MLPLLVQELQEANYRVLSQVQDFPGHADITPRPQSKLYSARVGQGVAPTLLHLARVGKLDLDRMRKILQDPAQVGLLMDAVKAI